MFTDKLEYVVANQAIEQNITQLNHDNIDFIINVNNLIAHFGPKNIHIAINALTAALFILHISNSITHTVPDSFNSK